MMPNAAKISRVPRAPGKPAARQVPRPTISSPWSLRTVRAVQILELTPFRKFPWLVHGFSTPTGGASILDSGERVLNLGFTDWDDRETVLKNRQTFQSALDASDHTLMPLKQIHSSVARLLQAPPDDPCRGLPAPAGLPVQAGDASLTNSRGILLGVQTADCVPI